MLTYDDILKEYCDDKKLFCVHLFCNTLGTFDIMGKEQGKFFSEHLWNKFFNSDDLLFFFKEESLAYDFYDSFICDNVEYPIYSEVINNKGMVETENT